MVTNQTNSERYWDIKNKTETSADLYIYSEISSYGEEWGDTSAKDIINAVKALGDISQLNVYISSPGGSVSEGMAIRTFLARQKCRKDVYIDSLCASIATAIAFGIGGTVHMEKTALVMIHNAWSRGYGNAADFRRYAEMLDKHDATIRSVYTQRSAGKLTEEEIGELMAAETWFTADECLENGFIDEVIDSGVQTAACLPKEYFDRYKNVPQNVAVNDGSNEIHIEIPAATQAVIDKANAVLARYSCRKEQIL